MTPEERARVTGANSGLKWLALVLDLLLALFLTLFIAGTADPRAFPDPGWVAVVGFLGSFIVGFFGIFITYLAWRAERDRRHILARHQTHVLGGCARLQEVTRSMGENGSVTEMHLHMAGLDFWLGQEGASTSPGAVLFGSLHDGEVVNLVYASNDSEGEQKGSGWILAVNGAATSLPVPMRWKLETTP